MPKFTNLNQLQKHVNQFVPENILRNENVLRVLRGTMQQSIYDVVYGHYVPVEYKRRRGKGGLGDYKNMKFTKVEIKDGKLSILFENVTQGQTHFTPIYGRNIDSLHGNYITDTIEEGIGGNWYREGKWSEARPFVRETVQRIHANPQPLIDAVKKAFKQAGFQVK